MNGPRQEQKAAPVENAAADPVARRTPLWQGLAILGILIAIWVVFAPEPIGQSQLISAGLFVGLAIGLAFLASVLAAEFAARSARGDIVTIAKLLTVVLGGAIGGTVLLLVTSVSREAKLGEWQEILVAGLIGCGLIGNCLGPFAASRAVYRRERRSGATRDEALERSRWVPKRFV
jgi:MFS family permease